MKTVFFISGSILFFAGMAINIDSDNILRNLRKPGETAYKIPTGEFGFRIRSDEWLGR